MADRIEGFGFTSIELAFAADATAADLAQDGLLLVSSVLSALEALTEPLHHARKSQADDVLGHWFAMLYTMRMAKVVIERLSEVADDAVIVTNPEVRHG